LTDIPNPQYELVLVNHLRDDVWGKHNQRISRVHNVDGVRKKTEGEPEAEGVW
jgi:hypothetical protein